MDTWHYFSRFGKCPSGVSDQWFIRSMKEFFSLLLHHKLNFYNILSAFSFQPEDIKVAVKDFKTHFDKTNWKLTETLQKKKRKVSITHLYITSNAVYIVSAKTFYLYFFVVFPFTYKMKETHWILLYLTKKIHSDYTKNRLGLWKLMHHH